MRFITVVRIDEPVFGLGSAYKESELQIQPWMGSLDTVAFSVSAYASIVPSSQQSFSEQQSSLLSFSFAM